MAKRKVKSVLLRVPPPVYRQIECTKPKRLSLNQHTISLLELGLKAQLHSAPNDIKMRISLAHIIKELNQLKLKLPLERKSTNEEK